MTADLVGVQLCSNNKNQQLVIVSVQGSDNLMLLREKAQSRLVQCSPRKDTICTFGSRLCMYLSLQLLFQCKKVVCCF